MRVVLASGSPQRREMLERLGIAFDVVVPDVEEGTEGDPEVEVLANARRKAEAVAAPEALVIACDTEVVLDGRMLGKPADRAQAGAFLRRLSGRSHEVLSGLVVAAPGGDRREGLARSTVTFRSLAEADCARYLAGGEWRGRAGGYAIQGLGATLVAEVRGDLSNVIGLPVGLLLELAPELEPRA